MENGQLDCEFAVAADVSLNSPVAHLGFNGLLFRAQQECQTTEDKHQSFHGTA
jgi:hypothetical protein